MDGVVVVSLVIPMMQILLCDRPKPTLVVRLKVVVPMENEVRSIYIVPHRESWSSRSQAHNSTPICDAGTEALYARVRPVEFHSDILMPHDAIRSFDGALRPGHVIPSETHETSVFHAGPESMIRCHDSSALYPAVRVPKPGCGHINPR